MRIEKRKVTEMVPKVTERTIYICENCGKIFDDEKDCLEHVKIHKNEDEFKKQNPSKFNIGDIVFCEEAMCFYEINDIRVVHSKMGYHYVYQVNRYNDILHEEDMVKVEGITKDDLDFINNLINVTKHDIHNFKFKKLGFKKFEIEYVGD